MCFDICQHLLPRVSTKNPEFSGGRGESLQQRGGREDVEDEEGHKKAPVNHSAQLLPLLVDVVVGGISSHLANNELAIPEVVWEEINYKFLVQTDDNLILSAMD